MIARKIDTKENNEKNLAVDKKVRRMKKLKKATLMNMAKMAGKEVTEEMTKAQIIDIMSGREEAKVALTEEVVFEKVEISKEDAVRWSNEAKGLLSGEYSDGHEDLARPPESDAIETPDWQRVERADAAEFDATQPLCDETVEPTEEVETVEPTVEPESKIILPEVKKKAPKKKAAKKKGPSKMSIKLKKIELAMDQLLSDLNADVEGIQACEENEDMWKIEASLLGSRYRLVKTYGRDRNAWKGNGTRSQDGNWDGHRHPAARFLLEKGFESELRKRGKGWELVITKLEKYLEKFAS
jgi:hypothetical protein